jgi:hypothetical protein
VTARRPAPIHPLLLAAYAVLFLYASNLSEADLGQVLPVLVLVLVIVGALLIAGALVLRDALRAAVLLSAAVAVFFGYRHVAILTDGLPIEGRPVQLVWLALGLGALLLAWSGGRPLRIATRALNALGVALVIVALVTILPYELGQVGRASSGPAALPSADRVEGAERRDIWFLVFDRYGSAESLRLNYGIEDELTPWLAARGFHVTPDARANYARTRLSLASILNLDYLDELRGRPVAEMLQDHAVGRFLTGLGYRYIHIGSEYQPTRTSPLADVSRSLYETSDFATALFDSSLASEIVERLSPLEPRRQRQVDWGLFAFAALDEAREEPGPKFVFAHLLLPHPPYVFNADGRILSDEEAARRPTGRLYEGQLHYLNDHIKAVVEPLLALPEDERPIIVLTADEGPYPKRYEGDPLMKGPDPDFDWSTGTVEELRIKFGILHAMYLPGVALEEVPPSITSVNTFRFLFSRYFGADLPLLETRTLVPIGAEQELVDVTERLDSEE